jgi:hypothetical protein
LAFRPRRHEWEGIDSGNFVLDEEKEVFESEGGLKCVGDNDVTSL